MEQIRAIVTSCQSEKLKNRLHKIIETVIHDEILPFRTELFDLYDLESDFRYSPNNYSNCLVFIETTMDNFEKSLAFFYRTYTSHKNIQIVLIASSTHNYFEIALKYNIANLIMKESLNTSSIAAIIKRLLGDTFFGFKPFFINDFPKFDKTYILENEIHTKSLSENYFSDFLKRLASNEQNYFKSYITELIVNALTYGIIKISPEERDSGGIINLPEIIKIPPNEKITIRIVEDDEKYGISVIDNSGSLESSRILKKIRRHTSVANEVIPPGIEDPHGRGFFILSNSNRLVVNILKEKMTEVILMHFYEPEQNKYQPLIINEKDSE